MAGSIPSKIIHMQSEFRPRVIPGSHFEYANNTGSHFEYANNMKSLLTTLKELGFF
jgi:hypothetical protein